MAAVVYPLGKVAFMSGGINLTSDTIKAALVTSSYTYSAAHQYWSSASANVVGTPQTLTSITLNSPSNGVFDAADATWTALTGSAANAIIIYKDTGTASTSPMIAYIDGVSVTPNGGDVTSAWDNTGNRIFAL